jgi:hypothetical protein
VVLEILLAQVLLKEIMEEMECQMHNMAIIGMAAEAEDPAVLVELMVLLEAELLIQLLVLL